MSNDLTLATRDVIRTSNDLLLRIYAAMPEPDRQTAMALELAGAEIGLTVKWTATNVEVRVGLIPGDSEPMMVFSASAERGGDESSDAVH